METPEYIEGLRIVGGDLALDFVNTEDGDPNVSQLRELRDYGDLVAWCGRVGLLDPDEAERLVGEAAAARRGGGGVPRALKLRGALYGVFRAVAEGWIHLPEPDGAYVVTRVTPFRVGC